ncbi:hypothetical protein [Sodaliphilus sp.]|uniref:hypothetical protein n=1 Tax=Sodaliphilus sp. TaxID=2815818 RepID=UPI00388D55C2
MKIFLKHLAFIPLCAVFVALLGWLVMLLWNWLMPSLFGLSELGYWQACGLLVLCKILFGGLGGHHHGHHHHRMCHSNKLRERWENMTPEERERIIEQHKGA